jgi:predicted peptidase
MCPALTYSKDSTTKLSLIRDIPIWFAHATNDNVIPVDVSRSAVFTLKNAGAKDITLTEFTDQEMLSAGALVGYHQSDFVVMTDDSFADWLFSKRRSD